jgi:HTH-type transcriptional regulator/antitoxin HigA
MPPQAIMDEVQYDSSVELIDRLMASGKLTKGQELYMETLVQLVQAYEAAHHAIDAPKGPEGIAALRHLLDAHGMNASALARLLGVHASMGSKILNGERSLTVDHLKLLSAKFKVRADVFMA